MDASENAEVLWSRSQVTELDGSDDSGSDPKVRHVKITT
jgi:hypothetical protein